jgi:hypothetical protein
MNSRAAKRSLQLTAKQDRRERDEQEKTRDHERATARIQALQLRQTEKL